MAEALKGPMWISLVLTMEPRSGSTPLYLFSLHPWKGNRKWDKLTTRTRIQINVTVEMLKNWT